MRRPLSNDRKKSEAAKKPDPRMAALAELFPTAMVQSEVGGRAIGGLMMIARERIIVLDQFRKNAQDDVDDLRENIAETRKRGLGIESSGIHIPLIVRPATAAETTAACGEAREGYFVLIAGERRYWASQPILSELPCLVTDSNEAAARVIQGVENVKRKNFAPLEEAAFVAEMRVMMNLSIRETAEFFGENRGWVENRVNLHNAGEDVKKFMSVYNDTKKYPGATQTNALLIERQKEPALRAQLLKAAKNGATEAALRKAIEAHYEQKNKSEANSTVTSTGSTPGSAGITVGKSTPPPVVSTSPTPIYGQSATPAGTTVPPRGGAGQGSPPGASAEGSSQADALRQLVQPAGTTLAEAVRLLKSGESPTPPRAALESALDVIEAQVKQLRGLSYDGQKEGKNV